jgi:DNA repair protein RecN (Recombination protein N)
MLNLKKALSANGCDSAEFMFCADKGKRIGEKLIELSKSKQVFSITHLAQVAAFAKTHIKIYKENKNSRTYTKAKMLTKTEHIEEIARMIPGEKITQPALEHAKNLVAASTSNI